MKTAILFLVILAPGFLVLAGIWTGDHRWTMTGGVVFAVLGILTWLAIRSRGRREGKKIL